MHCKISLDHDGAFTLTIPSDTTTNEHTIRIARSAQTGDILHRILQSRQQSRVRTISTEAMPLQSMVDGWFRADNAKRQAEREAAHAELAEMLGISPDAIEI